MTPFLLLLEESPLPSEPGELAALGLPRGFRAPEHRLILRFDGISAAVRARLALLLRQAGGELHEASRADAGVLIASCPEDALPSIARRLGSSPSPFPDLGLQLRSALEARRRPPVSLRLARRRIPLGRRTLVLGVLNVTPDSFYDGGRWTDPGLAAERAFRMEEEGAGVVDLGGESTRPGSRPATAREEKERILPVLARLIGRLRIPVSVDTMKSEVAAAALDAGAGIVNDVSGLSFDPRIARVAARHGAGVILSHIRGRPRTMQRNPLYRHLIPEIAAFLREAAGKAVEAGVDPGAILIDPGIGFGKTALHNLLLLKHLALLRSAGHPILVGASRKSFLGKILDEGPEGRLEGSLAAAALAVTNGASAVRVHDVAETVRVVRIAEAIRDAALSGPKG